MSLFNDVFRLQYAENVGAFLSLGTTLPEEIRILRSWVHPMKQTRDLFNFPKRRRLSSSLLPHPTTAPPSHSEWWV